MIARPNIIDINRDNRKKTQGPRSVALEENIEDLVSEQRDQQTIDGKK